MRLHLLFLQLLALTASTCVLGLSQPATAAERVVLRYRIFQKSVSIPELATFAQTGTLSPELRTFINMSGKNPDDVRQALMQEVKVNPVILYQALNTRLGTALLDRISQAIHAPGGGTSRDALRSALINSALPDGKITLIEALQNYPSPDVDVDGDALVSIYQQLAKLAQRLPKI